MTKFYDVNVESIDWQELNQDWERFTQLASYQKIKEALVNTNGFNTPIEFPNPLGGENFRPKILFAQVSGRRNNLNAIDLAKMQQINSNLGNDSIYRLPITYDFVLSGFNGLM